MKLNTICPKLPMRVKPITRNYYFTLGFKDISAVDYDGYLIMERDGLEIHFFEYNDLEPKDNYGQVYIKVNAIEELYQEIQSNGVQIHPNGNLITKPWGQKEFSLLDPDSNLITFGESV